MVEHRKSENVRIIQIIPRMLRLAEREKCMVRVRAHGSMVSQPRVILITAPPYGY